MAKSLDDFIRNVPSQTLFHKVELYNFTNSGASKFIYVSTPLTAEELQCVIAARGINRYAQVKEDNMSDLLHKPDEVYGLDSFCKILLKLKEKRYYSVKYNQNDGTEISFTTNDIELIIDRLKKYNNVTIKTL